MIHQSLLRTKKRKQIIIGYVIVTCFIIIYDISLYLSKRKNVFHYSAFRFFVNLLTDILMNYYITDILMINNSLMTINEYLIIILFC